MTTEQVSLDCLILCCQQGIHSHDSQIEAERVKRRNVDSIQKDVT